MTVPIVPPLAPRPRKRSAWRAGLASFLVSGLGQLYNGRPRRAAWLFLAAALIVGAGDVIFLGLPPSLGSLIAAGVTLSAYIAVKAYAIIDAIVGATQAGRVALKRYQRGWVYCLIVVVAVAAGYPYRRSHSWSAGCPPDPSHGFSFTYPMASWAMAPSLERGDVVFAARQYYCSHSPQRGDLAVIRLPNTGVNYIRRVIGLPGDTVRIADGRLWLNGAPVAREPAKTYVLEAPGVAGAFALQYVETLPGGVHFDILRDRQKGPLDNTPSYSVPPDHYFVLADNRDEAPDSRLQIVGFVPRAAIVDRPEYVVWSLDRARIGLRLK